MTHTIDTSPEAIAALLDGVTPGPWNVCNYDAGDCTWYDHNGPCPSVQASEDLDCAIVHWDGFKQKYWSACNGDNRQIQANARFIAAARELVPALAAERDEARALLALISTKQGIGHAAPADASAALAARDAAMRNEGRRQAAEIARADAQSETGPILRRRLSGSGTPVAASARRRQAIRTARRILAALEPEGGE